MHCPEHPLCDQRAGDFKTGMLKMHTRECTIAGSSFTSYSKDAFDDHEQKRLRKVYGDLDKKGAFVMLSNSDPKNNDPDDNFFDDLYHEYHIERLNATRLINCNAERRGSITEILVMNY